MLEVAVYNMDGKQVDSMPVDRNIFGGFVNKALVKQAVVIYHGNKRQGSATTKSRGMVKGSTRKLFRQKGTGNARRGNLRTNVVRGGGVAFAKLVRDHHKKLPQKMRKAALDSAILAKIISSDLMVVDGLKCEKPKTSEISRMLENLKINRSCLLTLDQRDSNVYLSCRNIPDLTVRIREELNAFDVVTRQKMLVTTEAMKAMLAVEVRE